MLTIGIRTNRNVKKKEENKHGRSYFGNDNEAK